MELGSESVFKKLGKSIVALNDIIAGQKLSQDVLSGRIFNKQYIPVRESNKVVGRIAKRDIKKGEPIVYNDLN